ncbi:MAG: dihydrolipoamide acetyltransferase [Deltaproteobacteria bacterium]|nr:dihydrolipoamide acetyltransferase [Deltaproteobacteria bacterium]
MMLVRYIVFLWWVGIIFMSNVLSAQDVLNQPNKSDTQTQVATDIKAEQPDDVKSSETSSQSASKPQMGDDTNVINEAYTIQIKNLEEKVNELKERVFRSKARLTLLQETVLMGKISGAKMNMVFSNEMGASFKLESMSFSLDGTQIFSKVNQDGSLENTDVFEILPPSSMVPGNHTVSVYLVYRGHGFGLFTYLNQYKFKVKSSYTFYVEEGKITKVKVVAYEKGNLATDLKDRPAVRFDVEIKPVVDEKKSIPVSAK